MPFGLDTERGLDARGGFVDRLAMRIVEAPDRGMRMASRLATPCASRALRGEAARAAAE